MSPKDQSQSTISDLRSIARMRSVLVKPVVSEKSYQQFDEGIYTFLVAKDANKIEIRQAVEEIFNVRVARVNTLNRKGKQKRNRKSNVMGKRPDQKRAVVTLVEGDRIEILGS